MSRPQGNRKQAASATRLAFRDALRRDETLRAESVKVKEAAVTAAPTNRARYNELKQSLFEKAKESGAALLDYNQAPH